MTRLAAVLLATGILVVDVLSQFDASVSVLYVLVLLVGGHRRGVRSVSVWAGISIILAMSGYVIVHWGTWDPAATSRLAFAMIAIGTTAALLVARRRLRLAFAELSASRLSLEAFTGSVPVMLWGTRADGYCDFLNTRFTEVTGMAAEEAIRNQTWTDPIHPDDIPPFLAMWDEARRSASELRTHFRVRHRDGSYRWMHSVGRPILDAETGEIVRWYGGLSDVDEEFKAQETLRGLNRELEQRVEERTERLRKTEWRFRALYDDRNIGFAELDFSEANKLLLRLKQEGVTDLGAYVVEHPHFLAACVDVVRTVNANDALLRMLGKERREGLDIGPLCQNTTDAAQVLLKQLEALFEGRDMARGTTVLVGADGRRVPVFFAVNLSPQGMSYSTLFDVGERERVHELMLAAQQEAARANRLATMGAFSASLAHELNQPISSIAMDVETSFRSFAKGKPDTQAITKILERVQRNALRMQAIVETTRDRVTQGKRNPVPVDLGLLVAETAALLDRELTNNRVVLEFHRQAELPTIPGDPIEIQQVLINLMTNAVDALNAMPLDNRSLSLSVVRTPENGVRVAVADNGPGIPEEDLGRVFQSFYTTKPGGIGMGLQICQANIEALGGKLTVHNRREGGAVFAFTLPVTPAPFDPA